MNWGVNTTISSGLLISVFSMVVVFLILLIISYMIDLVRVLTGRKSGKKAEKKEAKQSSKSTLPSADDETAMAIAVSIASYLQRGIKVKSIKEVSTGKTIGSSIEVK